MTEGGYSPISRQRLCLTSIQDLVMPVSQIPFHQIADANEQRQRHQGTGQRERDAEVPDLNPEHGDLHGSERPQINEDVSDTGPFLVQHVGDRESAVQRTRLEHRQ